MSKLWMPSIEVETNSGIRTVSLNTRHLMKRRIFLTGSIDEEQANDFISQYLYLKEESSEPISVYINSPGGEVSAGLMIYDILNGSETQTDLYCTGMAASMAAVILASGKKGHRFILPHSKVMIHEPLIPNGVGGSATSIENISRSILETRDILNGILADHTGKTLEEINKATAYDHYMNAKEAIEFGICDDIRNI